MKNESMTIFGNGEQKRAFSYIGDVAPAIARSICCRRAYGEIFNVGADTPYTVNHLAAKIAEVFAVELKVKYLEPRNEVEEAYSDHAKARKILNVIPKTSLGDGLRLMAEWVKQHGVRKSKEFKNIEVHTNLPPSWTTRTTKP